jgi:hypothetical protein
MSGRSIEELVGLLAETREGNTTLYQELKERATELGLPLEFTVEHCDYQADANGLWAARISHDRHDSGDVEAITPEEYLDALHSHLLEQIRNLSLVNHGLRELIKKFAHRQATWAELKQAAK